MGKRMRRDVRRMNEEQEKTYERLKTLMESLNATVQVWRAMNGASIDETMLAMEGVGSALNMQAYVESIAEEEDEG